MQFSFYHNNINVSDLEKSIAFYQKALGLREVRRRDADDRSYIIVYMGDANGTYFLELTWLRDHPQPYDLGENEFHMALSTDDIDAAYALHKEMDCICFENKKLNVYFICDPDGYWIEVLDENRRPK